MNILQNRTKQSNDHRFKLVACEHGNGRAAAMAHGEHEAADS